MRRFQNNKPNYIITILSQDISEILLKCPFVNKMSKVLYHNSNKYGIYVKIFEPIDIIKDFLDMKAWLDDKQPLNVETEEIWGVLQSTYTIEDMHAWVNSGETLQQKKKCSPTPDDCSKGKQ